MATTQSFLYFYTSHRTQILVIALELVVVHTICASLMFFAPEFFNVSKDNEINKGE